MSLKRGLNFNKLFFSPCKTLFLENKNVKPLTRKFIDMYFVKIMENNF